MLSNKNSAFGVQLVVFAEQPLKCNLLNLNHYHARRICYYSKTRINIVDVIICGFRVNLDLKIFLVSTKKLWSSLLVLEFFSA